MANDLTACRREVAEVRDTVENIAAAGHRRELEAHQESENPDAAEDRDHWPDLPITSDTDWSLMTALVLTEESQSQPQRMFTNYLARRIIAHAKNAKAPIKAAIRCVIEKDWAAKGMTMLGWRIINGKKILGFKAFSDIRPFIITTLNEVC